MPKTVVTLVTAVALSDNQKKMVVSELEPKLGSIELKEEIDPAVMGGLKIKLGSQEFDATLAGKLQRIEKQVPDVVVTTAVPLTDEQRATIKQTLEDKMGSVSLVEDIDPAILGGIRIIAGSKEIDATVKGRLNRLKTKLLQTI